MVKLNKSTRIGLYAVAELALKPDAVTSAREIAVRYGVSEHHVAKVLQHLARVGIVHSVRGMGGGFQLARDPKQITLMDVVEVFERQSARGKGPLLEEDAGRTLEVTRRLNEVFEEIQEQAVYTLKSITVATLLGPKKIS